MTDALTAAFGPGGKVYQKNGMRTPQALPPSTEWISQRLWFTHTHGRESFPARLHAASRRHDYSRSQAG